MAKEISYDFLWGAATSSHQVEGGNDKNDWWDWEAQGNVEGGVRSGVACDHWKRFREDIQLARELGLNSYRFSVEWSRIEPEEGVYKKEALEWYEELIGECEKNQILPVLTLHHFTSPLWFCQKGGFTNQKLVKNFVDFVDHVVTAIGKRVPMWCTINEPMVYVVGTYLAGFMPPAQFDPKAAAKACGNLFQAHVRSYDLIHSKLKKRQGSFQNHPLQVGVAKNMLDFMPERLWHPMELLLSELLHNYFNKAWLDALVGKKQSFGITGLLPKARIYKNALGRRTADFIGLNYYTKAYIRWKPKKVQKYAPKDAPIDIYHAKKKEKQSDMGWALHPRGLRRLLNFINSYKLPIYITENGIADKKDGLRKEFLVEHLKELALAKQRRIDIRGYFHWSLLDNFEWVYGFWPRFGLYHVNYETQERTLKKSARTYQRIIEMHRYQAPALKILHKF